MTLVLTLGKLVWIELKLFFREPLSLSMAIAFPLLVQAVMAGVFGSQNPGAGSPFKGVIGIDYYTPSSMAIVIAALGLVFLPVRLATYRERGILRRFQASSVPGWALFSSLAVVTLAVSLVRCWNCRQNHCKHTQGKVDKGQGTRGCSTVAPAKSSPS